MEWFSTAITIVTGLLIRFGFPIGVTAVLVWVLRKLDQRWQSEAERQPEYNLKQARNPGCWDVKNCPVELQRTCSAHAHPETPCWQVFRQQDGLLQERCLGCQVFREAVVPALV